MFKIYRCKETRQVRYLINNKFGYGHCDNLLKLKEELKPKPGDANTRSKYIDRVDLMLDRDMYRKKRVAKKVA